MLTNPSPCICGDLQAYMNLSDVEAAIESFTKALELEPNDGEKSCFFYTENRLKTFRAQWLHLLH